MGTKFPVFPITWDFTWLPRLFKYHEVCLGNSVSQFSWDSGVDLMGSHSLLPIQAPQVVMNLIFSYGGRDFASPVPLHLLRRCGRTGFLWRLSQKCSWVPHHPSHPLLPVFQHCWPGGSTFLDLPCLPVLVSTTSVFVSFHLILPAGSSSVMLVSCLHC